MLETLQCFCDQNGITFRYGTAKDFNIESDAAYLEQPVIHYTGYYAGSSTPDVQGAFIDTLNVNLSILTASSLANTSESRLPGFEQVNRIRHRLQKYLSRDYVLSPVNFQDGILNKTDSNRMGLALTFTAKLRVTPPYC